MAILLTILTASFPETTHAQVYHQKHERVVRVLPHGHNAVKVNHTSYRYHSGVFYRPVRSGYVVVSAPNGAVVRSLPRTYATVRIGRKVYYRAEDTYFIRTKKGYRVVSSPYKNRR